MEAQCTCGFVDSSIELHRPHKIRVNTSALRFALVLSIDWNLDLLILN